MSKQFEVVSVRAFFIEPKKVGAKNSWFSFKKAMGDLGKVNILKGMDMGDRKKEKGTKFVLDMEFNPEARDVSIDVLPVDDDEFEKAKKELRYNERFERLLDRIIERDPERKRRLRTFDKIRDRDE